ncbi:MAG TPA: hypothetical protein PLO67_12300 [Saprospiraceae bacterium]|jgi:hypothetical protein|nr:hypothetical protein [Saprospiraceae bacterium]HPI08633.1 hypothetical protein [Saprospiraceae bacterium]
MRAATFIWAVLLPLHMFAQDKTSRRPLAEHMPYSLKISPFALINPVQSSVTLHADIPLWPRWGLDAGVSGVYYSSIFSRYQGERFAGYKLMPTLKYYFQPFLMDHRYIGLMLKFSDIYNSRYYNTIRQGGQYEEWLLLKRRQLSGGFMLQFGGIDYLGKQKRWFLEPFLAFGVRWIYSRQGSLPPDVVRVRARGLFDFTLEEEVYSAPDGMMGIRVGRVLR